jgi:anti-anti-sigma regulatory factor/two-component sensor histidine kinase
VYVKSRVDTQITEDELHQSHLASIGQIAAGIAHEVRNPLTAVKGFLQLLKEKNDSTYIDVASSELDNALKTLENLLQVSRPNLQDEPYESVNLAVEVEAVLQLFQDQVYRVQMEKLLQNTNEHIYGKKNQLKKALFNLIKNAIEAIPEKGKISVYHHTNESQAILRIKDTGVGIPKDKLKLLGTPFFSTKSQGTGMGLTQVFSVIYEHGGNIQVNSKENEGTEFTISLPLGKGDKHYEVKRMDVAFVKGQDLKEFFIENKKLFEQSLLSEAVNVRGKVEEIQEVGNINLLQNAYRLVLLLVEGREHEIITFAKEEGEVWARHHSLTLAFKLEWIHALRRIVWDFLYNYDRLNEDVFVREDFYRLEKRINELLDQFLNCFFIRYSEFKDELIKSHREMVEDLSVPIIPLTSTMSILPLIGTIDSFRARTIIDKVITQIGITRMEKLIVDLSGVAYMDTGVVEHIIKIIDGASIMGCHLVITGIRAEIAKTMLKLGVSFENKAETLGTLQQALAGYFKA